MPHETITASPYCTNTPANRQTAVRPSLIGAGFRANDAAFGDPVRRHSSHIAHDWRTCKLRNYFCRRPCIALQVVQQSTHATKKRAAPIWPEMGNDTMATWNWNVLTFRDEILNFIAEPSPVPANAWIETLARVASGGVA